MNKNTRKAINPDIKLLLKKVIPSVKLKHIRVIIDKRNYDITESVEMVKKIDKTIGGMGIHNVNIQDKMGNLTGNYQIKDRPIYRSIQYVYVDLYEDNLEWHARDIVYKSCLHIENCLDRYCEEKINGPFGSKLYSTKGRTLPAHIWNPLSLMCKNVYNLAKHYIPEQVNYEDHLFSEADAIATYFICRKLGIEILKLIP